MTGTTFIITFTTRPEAASDLCAILNDVKRDLPTVAGCRGVNILCASDDPGVFTLLEQWDPDRLRWMGRDCRLRARASVGPLRQRTGGIRSNIGPLTAQKR